MGVKIAIHKREHSYSDRWIEYCCEHKLDHRVVCCYDTDIMSQLADMDVLMWNWHYTLKKDVLFARGLIYSAEAMGMVVFPNLATSWHYDDKIGQKYLLESAGLPLVPTYIFYELEDALRWIDTATFPKVFKLSKGSSSQNVQLVRTADDARRLANRMFGAGFKPEAGYFADAKIKIGKHRKHGNTLDVIKRAPKVIRRIREQNRVMGRERGYVYFQEFVPGNKFDTRISIIGDRAFGYRRGVRDNDFRASGSGRNDYDPAGIHHDCIRIAFDIARKLGTQSVACDFIRTEGGPFLLAEISYCYVSSYIYSCPGHWDPDLNWHDGPMWPEHAMIEDAIAAAEAKKLTPTA